MKDAANSVVAGPVAANSDFADLVVADPMLSNPARLRRLLIWLLVKETAKGVR